MKDYLEKIYDQIKCEKSLVTDFFITFSRFEYALKRKGYTNCGKDMESVFANWDRFASEIKGKLDISIDMTLSNALDYIKTNPPEKQILKDGVLEWKETRKFDRKEPLELYIVKNIRVVRNNLFHGGKFPLKPVSDSARNKDLLSGCLVILQRLLEINQDIKEAFNEID